jgi:hypothetical protein
MAIRTVAKNPVAAVFTTPSRVSMLHDRPEHRRRRWFTLFRRRALGHLYEGRYLADVVGIDSRPI